MKAKIKINKETVWRRFDGGSASSDVYTDMMSWSGPARVNIRSPCLLAETKVIQPGLYHCEQIAPFIHSDDGPDGPGDYPAFVIFADKEEWGEFYYKIKDAVEVVAV